MDVELKQVLLSDNFPRNQAPVPSHSAMANTSHRLLFEPQGGSFEPVSRQLLDSLYTTHQSHQEAHSLVMEKGTELFNTTMERFIPLMDGLSYEQLLQGMLYEGETILNKDCWLHYTFVEFKDEYDKIVIKPPMMAGRACITDKRIMFLSAENTAGAKLNKFGDPKKTPGGYNIETYRNDNIQYLTIPINCFKSVELKASVGSKASVNLHAKPACCCGIFGSCGFMCQIRMCVKTWYPDQPIYSTFNDRTLTLGVTLPPWMHKTMLKVTLQPTLPLSTARDFISALQGQAPDLYWGQQAS